ncbi:MAG: hypothetical protein CMO55_13735 [Verrucomicrobiales bacterium]|nr:hypothetical protein [Verrucomicrobiales bacterium]
MKLESTLGDRAGMLYTAPLMDVILLLIIFFLFGSNLVLKSGVEVKLPSSSSALPASEDAHIITLISRDSEEFYFNDDRVTLEKLSDLLEDARKLSSQVILLGDESVDYGSVMKISELLLRNGFDVKFAAQPENL